MDYFSKFLRSAGPPSQAKAALDHALEFNKSWQAIQKTLLHPDERQLTRGIKSTDVPAQLQSMVDSLVWESSRTEDGATGACLEYLLKNDVLGQLVKLSEADRPFGIQAEVLRAVQNMVVLLDEQFLVHAVVHRSVLRLLRNCVGDDITEKLDGTAKIMGAAKSATRTQPSEYEEDLVNLLCILCSRIRTYRELLMIFFHDKHWYHSDPLFSVEEDDEEEEEEEDEEEGDEDQQETESPFPKATAAVGSTNESNTHSGDHPSTSSQAQLNKKPEYEFLLFNYLLRFVHREGQIGDFARAGLLFLMDVAMSPGQPVHRLAGDARRESIQPNDSENTRAVDPVTDAALALAEYILDGDFSEVLGAGLGAVYSLLPSKIEFRTASLSNIDQPQGMVIGGMGPQTEDDKLRVEVDRDNNRAIGLEDASNPEFKYRLDHFLKLLEFLQDVLRRNRMESHADDVSIDPSALVGNAIVNSILDAVRRIFLENVLYPSILECADMDGSAVAVISYIEIMIRTLRNGPIADLLLDFLLSEDNDDLLRRRSRARGLLTLQANAPPRVNSSVKSKHDRRKSTAMAFLELEAPDSRRPTEYFTAMGRFTLKDLILTNLKSVHQSTSTAALSLLETLFHRHCTLCVDRLIIVTHDSVATCFPEPSKLKEHSVMENDADDDAFVYPVLNATVEKNNTGPIYVQPETTHLTHEREMGLYLTLVSRMDPSRQEDTFSTGYDQYLRDALQAITNQSCFLQSLDSESRAKLKHRINPNDPIISSTLECLRAFFSNSPEHNIALTGLLTTLSLCPNRSLGGWLTFANSDDLHATSYAACIDSVGDRIDGDDRSIDFSVEEKLRTDSNVLPASKLDDQSRPVVHSILHALVGQLDRYRQIVDEFDKYLLERRQGLLFSENMTDALSIVLELPDRSGGPHPYARRGPPAPETPQRAKPTPKPKPRSSASAAFVSFLTPNRRKVTPFGESHSTSTPPYTPIPGNTSKSIAASPFGAHYQQTLDVVIEPLVADVAPSGQWTPSKSMSWQHEADEGDVFTDNARWGGDQQVSVTSQSSKALPHRTVTLSHLLDNVVILQESIKELVAIIHARRSLGIDGIRYV